MLTPNQQREAIELLRLSAGEIKQLREVNRHQGARLKMFDDVMLILTARVEHNMQGAGEDLAWKIDQFVEQNQEQG